MMMVPPAVKVPLTGDAMLSLTHHGKSMIRAGHSRMVKFEFPSNSSPKGSGAAVLDPSPMPGVMGALCVRCLDRLHGLGFGCSQRGVRRQLGSRRSRPHFEANRLRTRVCADILLIRAGSGSPASHVPSRSATRRRAAPLRGRIQQCGERHAHPRQSTAWQADINYDARRITFRAVSNHESAGTARGLLLIREKVMRVEGGSTAGQGGRAVRGEIGRFRPLL